MPTSVVLHTTSTLIQFGVSVLHDVEWVSHQNGVRAHRVENLLVSTRQIQGPILDVLTPQAAFMVEPQTGFVSGSPFDNVQQRSVTHINYRSRPVFCAE